MRFAAAIVCLGVLSGVSRAANPTAALLVDAAPYRAVCDGATDDSAAIQACVDESAKQGLPCRLPGRTCVFGRAGSHAALSIPDGGGLTGNGALGLKRSVLRLDTDGGGPCGLAVNGAIRFSDGNSAKVFAGLTVRSGDPRTGCLVNASNAKSQVAGVRVQDADFYPAPGATATVGLYLGNVVTSAFERDYFAPGFDAAVVDGGAFLNAVHFRDDFFDEPPAASTHNFMVTLGTLSGSDFTGSVFETGPNGLSIRDGHGVLVSDNWLGDLHATGGGTWLSVSGGGVRVSANFLNCESPRARQTGIRVSGQGGAVVEANWIDGARVGIVAAGNANVVRGNEIYYPESIGVEVSTGTGQEIGPNDVTIGGGRRRTYLCDASAHGDRVVVTGPRGAAAASDCASRNTVENLSR